MELETVMAKAFDDSSTHLTPQICKVVSCKQRRGNHDSRREGEPCEHQEEEPSSLWQVIQDEGHQGKTGMFWLSMMDHARLVFMMDFSVKTNNFELFHHCNGAMADLLFAYEGHNYSR